MRTLEFLFLIAVVAITVGGCISANFYGQGVTSPYGTANVVNASINTDD